MDNPFRSFFHLKKPEHQCDNKCGQSYLPGLEVIVTRHIGRSTMQYAFCSQSCASDYYLKRLNQEQTA